MPNFVRIDTVYNTIYQVYLVNLDDVSQHPIINHQLVSSTFFHLQILPYYGISERDGIIVRRKTIFPEGM